MNEAGALASPRRVDPFKSVPTMQDDTSVMQLSMDATKASTAHTLVLLLVPVCIETFGQVLRSLTRFPRSSSSSSSYACLPSDTADTQTLGTVALPARRPRC